MLKRKKQAVRFSHLELDQETSTADIQSEVIRNGVE